VRTATANSGRTDGISVVIPTRGRVPLVRAAVESLQIAGKRLAGDHAWEVVLVDDSPGPEAGTLQSLAERTAHVRYCRGPARVGAKRNHGAAEARYDHLVFLDSDCTASESFLVAHLAAAQRQVAPSGRPVGAIAGPVQMAADADSWRTRLADYSPLFNAPFGWPAQYAEVYWSCTANLAVSRRNFEAVGGFDEQTFTVVGGEDVDFCLRLQDGGYAICTEPGAVAVHTRTLLTSFTDMAGKMLLYGRSSVYNTVRHPRHAQRHANPVLLAVAGAGALASRSRAARLAVLTASAAWFGVQSVAMMRSQGRSALVLPAIALEWIFDAGLAAEAVRRGRPEQVLHRFGYFDESRYVPFGPAPQDAAEISR